MTITDATYVNPARAGMILTITDLTETEISKPRTRGDDPRREFYPVTVNE